MTQPVSHSRNGDISQHILPTSATMVGVCITLIGIVRLVEIHAEIATIADTTAAGAAVIFLFSTLLSYMSLRGEGSSAKIERVADLLFLVGLVLLVACGIMLALEVGQFSTAVPTRPTSG